MPLHPHDPPREPGNEWRPRRRIWRRELHPGHHPLVKQLSDIMERERYSVSGVSEAAGYYVAMVGKWHNEGTMPNLAAFDAVLNVMGYKLAIVKKEKTK